MRQKSWYWAVKWSIYWWHRVIQWIIIQKSYRKNGTTARIANTFLLRANYTRQSVNTLYGLFYLILKTNLYGRCCCFSFLLVTKLSSKELKSPVCFLIKKKDKRGVEQISNSPAVTQPAKSRGRIRTRLCSIPGLKLLTYKHVLMDGTTMQQLPQRWYFHPLLYTLT